MKNIIVKELTNGFKKLSAKEGFYLYDKVVKQIYSVAIVKDTNDYIAIRDPQNPVEEKDEQDFLESDNTTNKGVSLDDTGNVIEIDTPESKEDLSKKYNFDKNEELEEGDVVLDFDDLADSDVVEQ